MSKFRIKGFFKVDTTAHAGTILSFIEEKISGKAVFLKKNFNIWFRKSSSPEVIFDVQMEDEMEYNAVWNFIKNNTTSNPTSNWISRMEVHRHLCREDEGVNQDCRQSQFEEIVK